MTFDLINIWRLPCYIHEPSLVPIELQLFKGDPNNTFLIFNFSSNLTSDDLWPQYVTWTSSTMNVPMLYLWTKFKWFQSDFNFSKETQITKTNIFHLTWPQMTLDLGMWPLTSLTYEGTPIVSLTQVWYKIGLIEPIFIGRAMSCKNIGRDAVEPNILKLIARSINIGRKASNFIIIMFCDRFYQHLDTSKHNNGVNRSMH